MYYELHDCVKQKIALYRLYIFSISSDYSFKEVLNFKIKSFIFFKKEQHLAQPASLILLETTLRIFSSTLMTFFI